MLGQRSSSRACGKPGAYPSTSQHMPELCPQGASLWIPLCRAAGGPAMSSPCQLDTDWQESVGRSVPRFWDPRSLSAWSPVSQEGAEKDAGPGRGCHPHPASHCLGQLGCGKPCRHGGLGTEKCHSMAAPLSSAMPYPQPNGGALQIMEEAPGESGPSRAAGQLPRPPRFEPESQLCSRASSDWIGNRRAIPSSHCPTSWQLPCSASWAWPAFLCSFVSVYRSPRLWLHTWSSSWVGVTPRFLEVYLLILSLGLFLP